MPGLMHKVQAIMSQRYYGDITIVPSFGVDDYLNIVSNPTDDFLMNATLKGERATWPSMVCSIIWNILCNRWELHYINTSFFFFLFHLSSNLPILEISIIKNHCSIEHCLDDII